MTLIVEARDAMTEAPLAGVQVRVQSDYRASPALTLVYSTLGDGVMRLPELRAGEYQIICERNGYLPATNLTVKLGSGDATERVTVRMTPQSSIEGTVLDEEGRPLAGVMMYAHRPGSMPEMGGETGREGRYRITGLQPGDYRVEARVPLDTRRKTLIRNPDTGESFGYPPTAYYPGGAVFENALLAQVLLGSVLPRIDLRLRRVPLVEFTGRLLERAGHDPLPGTRIELIDPKSPYNDAALSARQTAADGGFRFELLSPGHYEFALYRSSGGRALPTVIPIDIGKHGLTDYQVLAPAVQNIVVRVAALPNGDRWQGALRPRDRRATWRLRRTTRPYSMRSRRASGAWKHAPPQPLLRWGVVWPWRPSD